MRTNRPTWWCEQDGMPGLTRVCAVLYADRGERLKITRLASTWVLLQSHYPMGQLHEIIAGMTHALNQAIKETPTNE